MRMATLAPKGRIDEPTVRDEIARLSRQWKRGVDGSDAPDLLAEVLEAERLKDLDLFDQAQLATVIRVCRESTSLSEAGRKLFAASRLQKTSSNDADRLRKYLARFELQFENIKR
ncbi:hypothetical protein BN1110_06266 [bacterium YEK0313]|nr:hypothetical protein BN1110_06266 [bacterium YEK0313]